MYIKYDVYVASLEDLPSLSNDKTSMSFLSLFFFLSFFFSSFLYLTHKIINIYTRDIPIPYVFICVNNARSKILINNDNNENEKYG